MLSERILIPTRVVQQELQERLLANRAALGRLVLNGIDDLGRERTSEAVQAAGISDEEVQAAVRLASVTHPPARGGTQG